MPSRRGVPRTLDRLTQRSGCGSYPTYGTWPGLRAPMTWSINRDRYGRREFRKTFDGCFG